MADNERTSPRIAALAARFLKMEKPQVITDEMWSEMKSVFASTLTQAPDEPKNIFVQLRNAQIAVKGVGLLSGSTFSRRL